ncbi:uncharacterized protein LOC100888373 [Strongylocentrotus purpuratus]|uniref:DUF7869 domain-containing protein n=1 Tax=Strongylocentrotus purpuratus TaxID=7668 RepID=A0A7M7NC98_STRPU|nr:uncharacterized protein LOC100888373 [Strongylocentrotus purpuratus]XP_030834204.1 uncharacterized protein LOC100888373 [Strongylocentrotus purpuratus]
MDSIAASAASSTLNDDPEENVPLSRLKGDQRTLTSTSEVIEEEEDKILSSRLKGTDQLSPSPSLKVPPKTNSSTVSGDAHIEMDEFQVITTGGRAVTPGSSSKLDSADVTPGSSSKLDSADVTPGSSSKLDSADVTPGSSSKLDSGDVTPGSSSKLDSADVTPGSSSKLDSADVTPGSSSKLDSADLTPGSSSKLDSADVTPGSLSKLDSADVTIVTEVPLCNEEPMELDDDEINMDPTTDILVQWDDGSKNVVVLGDIMCNQSAPKKGSQVSMPWRKVTWHGVVLAVADSAASSTSDDEEEDNIPLSRLKGAYQLALCSTSDDQYDEEENVPLSRLKRAYQLSPCPSPTVPPRMNSTKATDDAHINMDEFQVITTGGRAVTPGSSSKLDFADVTPGSSSKLDSADVTPGSSSKLDSADVTPGSSSKLDSADVTPGSSSKLDSADVTPGSSSKLDSADVTIVTEVPLCNEEPMELGDDEEINVPVNDFQPESVSSRSNSTQKEKVQIPGPVHSVSHAHTGKEHPQICEKSKARKRVAQPQEWQQNIQKTKRIHGQPYHSRNGEARDARKVGEPCKDSCKLRCKDNFNPAQRKAIFDQYWQCGSFERQRDFICENVFDKQGSSGKKKNKTYLLPTNNGKQNVCHLFFLRTLSISQKTVLYTLQKRDGAFSAKDRRGRHQPSNKTSNDDVNAVRDHIRQFQVIESHYCRASTSRQYLPADLSLQKMYDMYASQTPIPISIKVYRRVFNTNFNLGFHPPKKDECKTCSCFSNSNAEEKESMAVAFNQHLKNKERARQEKKSDKEKAQTCPNSAAFTFDLQQVLSCPSAQTSVLFYKRKLSSYNLTVYSQADSEVHCYMWSEVDGNRGACEIGSCLINHLLSQPESVTDVSLFSDSCAGQNKNKYIAAALLHIVRTSSINVIDQKFLESGHTQMEVDSVHSTIEQVKRKVQVHHPDQWPMVASMARPKQPYHVKQLRFGEFFDLKKLAAEILHNTQRDVSGDKVQWTKMKHLRYEKSSPLTIKFKYDFDEEFHEVKVSASGRRMKNSQLEALYDSQLPISAAKKVDLVNLCNMNVIPSVYQSFYRDLPDGDGHRNCEE